jgi:hypothetical protein
MIDVTAYLMTLTICAVGAVGVSGKCEDGSEPSRLTLSLLQCDARGKVTIRVERDGIPVLIVPNVLTEKEFKQLQGMASEFGPSPHCP